MRFHNLAIPEPPVSVRASLSGDTNLEVSWLPRHNNGGVNSRSYSVEYKLDDIMGWTAAGNSSLLVLNVTYCPSFVYVFRVSAVNDVGSSEPSLVSAPIKAPEKSMFCL